MGEKCSYMHEKVAKQQNSIWNGVENAMVSFFAQWTERSEWEFHAISFLLKDILCYAAIAMLP